jgi:ATP-dependent Lon protease
MPSLTRAEEYLEVPARLPVVALRDLVFFPYIVLPILIGRQRSMTALREAQDNEGLVLLVTQKDPSVDDPDGNELFRVGTIAKIIQETQLPDGTSRVVLEGLSRARIKRLTTTTAALRASVELLISSEIENPESLGDSDMPAELNELGETVLQLCDDYAHLHERIPHEFTDTISTINDRVRLAHLVAGHLIIPALEKQEVLEGVLVQDQLSTLREILVREIEILRIERKLDRQIQLHMGGEWNPFNLSPKGAASGNQDSEREEWEEIAEQIKESGLPEHVCIRAEKELTRLRKLNPVAPEAAVIRTHLDWMISLPWTERSEDNLSVTHASATLDSEHFGLGEVKDRILEHVAVLSLVREMRGPILCLVGPPGVGKTSLGSSIAQALDREFVSVSLGGVRDEAEIRGHRRTYVGALPGRIIQGMRRSGTRNPVFLLDEIDKMARDFHGDPGSALLEVLDPTQNKSFTDHYLELEYDLSDVLFIATANTLQEIPDPLRDRMEVIRLPGYLDTEKREIAKRFLWPRQKTQHGLTERPIFFSDGAIHEIIRRYTREAGVRELNRRLSRIARKLARAVADGASPGEILGKDDLKDLLGPPTYQAVDRDDDQDRIGIANGLAWTSVGGEVMDVEVAIVTGSGTLRLTGTLGDVMKESAQAAVTYARSRATVLGLDPQFHKKFDIHIHIPEGATPKDGPSAGITIAAALISALTDIPTRGDIAMTGEITLRGRVIGVGGVKEKAVAALRSGMTRVVLPAANESDLETLPQEVLEALRFDLVRTMDEVMTAALTRLPIRVSTEAKDVGLSAPHG